MFHVFLVERMPLSSDHLWELEDQVFDADVVVLSCTSAVRAKLAFEQAHAVDNIHFVRARRLLHCMGCEVRENKFVQHKIYLENPVN